MSTAHIMANKEDIASTVIMPGDPKRAKYIADNFLTDVKEVNNIRNMTAYTGYYQNKRITVFPSGMGLASMGIYAHELYNFYDVSTIIRVGTAGATNEKLDLFDLVLVEKSYTESNFATVYSNSDVDVANSSPDINELIKNKALENGHKIYEGNVLCTECFYSLVKEKSPLIAKNNCLAVEMETFALFHIASKLGKKASCVLTISDSLITKKEISALEREKGLKEMITIVLEAIS